jgi:nicotinate-nucleotide adenylyltransferase
MDIVFGGTFNPPHRGHERVIERLLALFPQARIHLMPCWQPVHKSPTQVPIAIRRQWLQAFVAPWSNVTLDEREWHFSQPSFTLDSLRSWRQELGADAPLAFAIGSDSWAQFEQWHGWRSLLDLAHWLIVSRPDMPAQPKAEVVEYCSQRWLSPAQVEQIQATPAGYVMAVPGEPLVAASSMLRAAHQDDAKILPERVRVLWQDYVDQQAGLNP